MFRQSKSLQRPAPAGTGVLGAGPTADLEDLPLWRVQWAALPGTLQTLHVHVPHYAHMMETLLAGPQPWRIGHLLLPGGSANLGSPGFELRPRTRAPLVGTLLEVVGAMRAGDGRLLLLMAGVARFRVVRERQSTPYSRADVVVRERQSTPYSRADVVIWPDEEEVDGWRGPALAAVDAAASAPPMMTALMYAADRAAGAASVAAAQVWQDYELADLRAQAASEGGCEADQAGLGPPRLIWRESSGPLRMLEAQRPSVNTATERGVPVRGLGEAASAELDAALSSSEAGDAAADAYAGPRPRDGPDRVASAATSRVATLEAKRLVYQLSSLLVDSFDVAEDRQALLEAASLVARMKLLLSALILARNRLQLLVALQTMDEEMPG
ncbi:hypothetical protein WJX81_006943 [Elliptochloris bilobata]|uniref:Lon N-terminal domain-containing protein n=1 Tax=Elliptochloris bilobata TaxID=381761 RepID=A0AAW1RZT6_9CHLO